MYVSDSLAKPRIFQRAKIITLLTSDCSNLDDVRELQCLQLYNFALGLKAPDMEPLYVPLLPGYEREKIQVTVWGWTGNAFDEGDTASQWLSKYIGKPGLRLVRFDNCTFPSSESNKLCFHDCRHHESHLRHFLPRTSFPSASLESSPA